MTVDGPNGVGKSTLIENTVQKLKQNGLRVHSTKEVTDTTLGQFIRNSHQTYRGKTLALLLAADRQNHVEQDIEPALNVNDVVICDRYVAASLVFQRLDGVELPFLWQLNQSFLKPRLSVIVVASPRTIDGRLASRKSFDRFERSFSREAEIHLFKEAALFLEERGYPVRILENETASIAELVESLMIQILHLLGKMKS